MAHPSKPLRRLTFPIKTIFSHIVQHYKLGCGIQKYATTCWTTQAQQCSQDSNSCVSASLSLSLFLSLLEVLTRSQSVNEPLGIIQHIEPESRLFLTLITYFRCYPDICDCIVKKHKHFCSIAVPLPLRTSTCLYSLCRIYQWVPMSVIVTGSFLEYTTPSSCCMIWKQHYVWTGLFIPTF